MLQYPIPFIGICAYSGTGKTTVLTQLISLIEARGIRLGVIKHAHHNFDIDHKNKDSYKLRHAGAKQMVVASDNCIAKISNREKTQGIELEECLAALDHHELDLVLVEGFKHAHFPKIELHRLATQKPFIYLRDQSVIALASDQSGLKNPNKIPMLDINQVEQICDFIFDYLNKHSKIKHINYH